MAESLDAVSLYFRAIKDYPELSRESFNTLWYRANKGEKAAKTELVERNLRLVIPIAKKYYRPGLDFLDIIEEGNLGLMHAIDKFDPTKGFRFSTYGAYWIEQSIRRAIDEQSKTIRIPPHAWEALRRWLREWDRQHGILGRDPTLQEMAKINSSRFSTPSKPCARANIRTSIKLWCGISCAYIPKGERPTRILLEVLLRRPNKYSAGKAEYAQTKRPVTRGLRAF